MTDQSQAPVAKVTVTIANVATGVSQTASTDASGVYDAPYVVPGEYSLTFAKDGFKTFIRKGIVLHVETVTVDAVLEVGAISEHISVTAEAPLVQTESAVKSTTLTAQVITDAPSMNRSWYDLLAVLPGVNPGGGEQSSGQGIGVNGQQSFNANWQIDGGIAMFGQSANPDALTPPLESIEEVSLSTANFGAEHGNGLSAFNVITKSGTNNFHGSLYEYIQNEFFNARNYFVQGAKPAQRWNEYGGNLGGPIKRNKAFFFFNYERNPIRNFSPAPQSYPTDALKTGDFSILLGPLLWADAAHTIPVINPCSGLQERQGQIYDPATYNPGLNCRMEFPGNIIPVNRFDALAAKIQSYFPTAQLQNTLYRNYYVNLGNPVTNSWTNGKVDYNLTANNRLSASVLYSTFDQQFNDVNCALSCGAWAGSESQGQITDVWTINPNVVSEFRFSVSRANGHATVASQGQGWPAKLGMVNPIGDLFPTIWINGALNTGIGYAAGFPPAIDVETTFIPSEVVTWVKGKHIIKFGGEFDRWWVNTGWGTEDNGGYWFGGSFTQNPADGNGGEGYADFLLGSPSAYWISINPETGGRMWSAQTFVQDAYKAKSNLTLTAGLRYVIQSGWSEVNNKISSFDPTITNPATGTLGAMWFAGQNGRTALTKTIPNFFAPRVGVAWSPTSKLSVRGGFGIYSIIAGQNTTGPAAAWGQGWIPAYNGTYFQLAAGPPAGAIIYPTDATRTPDVLNGTPVTYSIYDSPLSYAAEYQLDVQYQLKGGVVLDLGYVGNRGVNLQNGRDLNQVPANLLATGQRPYPQFGDIRAALFDGRSNYNALQVSVKKQTSHGLSFAANYTWSKTLDTLTSAGWGGAGAAERGGYQNAYDPNSNYGAAANDIRHTLNGNLDYHLPFGSGKRYLNKEGVLNGLLGGWEVSSIFFLRGGLPFTPVMTNDTSGAGTAYGHHALRPNLVGDPNSGTCPGGDPVGTINCWFNPAAFAQPANFTFGNLGRNTLRGPNWRTFDVALLKSFALKMLGESGRLQFKLAITDVFNHPNLGIPGRVLGSGGEGMIGYANTSRQMQLGAKISF
ncbi:MAG: TonB-dependent receptor [Acidobacteriia bacterium]|nr:TonB-dependent receptor [Terriglobia bacterium]